MLYNRAIKTASAEQDDRVMLLQSLCKRMCITTFLPLLCNSYNQKHQKYRKDVSFITKIILKTKSESNNFSSVFLHSPCYTQEDRKTDSFLLVDTCFFLHV